ncbi:hypothetical protein VTK26DRAFT_5812 [Humicola hyalothermophila]
MKHLILVGACYLDTILTVPHFPEEDSKLRASAMQVRRGGNCPNSLEVLAQLLASDPQRPQLTLHLVSCLPDARAAATRTILSSFGDNPAIDFTHCLYRQGHDEPASSYIIRSSETGSRTIVNFNNLPEMTVDEFGEIADHFVGQGDNCWWHFEGRIPETTLRCIHYLRRTMPGCTVSVEVEKPGREGLVELAAEADVVLYSRSWAESRGFTSPEACLRAQSLSSRASLMLCTWGAQGAGCLSLPSGEYNHKPASSKGESIRVVDAVGAGDTFVAGILYRLHAGDRDSSREDMLEFAVGLATKKVQQEGFAGLLA